MEPQAQILRPGSIKSHALEQLARREVANQAAVGGEKVILGQVFEPRPAQLGEDAILQLA